VAQNPDKSNESAACRGLQIQQDSDLKEIIGEERDRTPDDVAANPARQCAQLPLTAGNRCRGIASLWKLGVCHRGSDDSGGIRVASNLTLESAGKERETTDELRTQFNSLYSSLDDGIRRLR